MKHLFITIFQVNILMNYELSKKLPYKDYKFLEHFNGNKYGQDYGCIILCDVKTSDKIRNDCLYR